MTAKNKVRFYNCENCNHLQVETEFGECAECGYEDLVEVTEGEYNDLKVVRFDSPNASFYRFEVSIEKRLYEDILWAYARTRYIDAGAGIECKDIQQAFEEELLGNIDWDLEEADGEPIDSVLFGYKCFESGMNQFTRIKLDCVKTGENSLAIKVDSYEMFSERY